MNLICIRAFRFSIILAIITVNIDIIIIIIIDNNNDMFEISN
jgi:hypothetical protein